jgi:hypothetical protein
MQTLRSTSYQRSRRQESAIASVNNPMPRRLHLLLALGIAAFVPAAAVAAPPSGEIAQQCAPAGSQAAFACYGADVVTRDAQAYAQPDRFEPAIQNYEHAWTHRALALQYELGNDVGFPNAQWLGTHNSFNSIAEEGPSLSDTDANQQLTLTDQLRLDMRSLEIDVHWFPSWRTGGASAPVVCHAGAVSDHDGCSTERLLGPVLDELAVWLRAHRDQALLLYVEDHLSGGYDTAAADIQKSLGSLVYRTGSTGGARVELPKTLTRDAVLASGAQVVIVSNGSEGSAWPSQAFSWRDHAEETPHGFRPFPDCGPNFTRAVYDTKLVRYFEDSTWLSSGASQVGGSEGDGITPTTAGALVRCGVDLLGFDQLVPGDGRLEAVVWSWARNEPSRGSCALIGADGRWRSSGCKRRLPATCRTSAGAWLLTTRAVAQNGATAACAAAGGVFAVPRTGYENESLKLVTAGASAWLGYARTPQGWSPRDAR